MCAFIYPCFKCCEYRYRKGIVSMVSELKYSVSYRNEKTRYRPSLPRKLSSVHSVSNSNAAANLAANSNTRACAFSPRRRTAEPASSSDKWRSLHVAVRYFLQELGIHCITLIGQGVIRVYYRYLLRICLARVNMSVYSLYRSYRYSHKIHNCCLECISLQD